MFQWERRGLVSMGLKRLQPSFPALLLLQKYGASLCNKREGHRLLKFSWQKWNFKNSEKGWFYMWKHSHAFILCLCMCVVKKCRFHVSILTAKKYPDRETRLKIMHKNICTCFQYVYFMSRLEVSTTRLYVFTAEKEAAAGRVTLPVLPYQHLLAP